VTKCPNCLTHDFVHVTRGEDYTYLHCETCDYEELDVNTTDEAL